VLLFLGAYPLLKRFSAGCHYYLGAALGLAPLCAWIAIDGKLEASPFIIGAAVLLWTAGFDIIYATQDYECDVRDGVHSVPADFGIAAALVQTRVVHALTVVCLVIGGLLVSAGWAWYAGVAVAAGLLAYENAIVKPHDLSRVNAAFFTVNGIIAIVVFAGALADRLLA
jgi:4-hydroxybenzoate polyprenyltransferase